MPYGQFLNGVAKLLDYCFAASVAGILFCPKIPAKLDSSISSPTEVALVPSGMSWSRNLKHGEGTTCSKEVWFENAENSGQTFGATDGGNRDRAATEYIAESSWVLPSNCAT